MENILFRGKRTDNGEWVEGYYIPLYDYKHDKHSYRIYTGMAAADCDDLFPDWFEVDPSTVGQYIGLTDKDGRKIFVGDIVEGKSAIYKCIFVKRFARFALQRRGTAFAWCNPKFCRIIGNIYDSPWLMEAER